MGFESRKQGNETFKKPDDASLEFEDIFNTPYFKKGRRIRLVKKSITGGAESPVTIGTELYGVLLDDMGLGRSIDLGRGGNTSAVKSAYHEAGKTFIRTETSLYEIVPGFEGLSLKNAYGEISLPEDAHEANLNEEVIDRELEDPGGKKYKIYINKPALKDILLETHGGNLFRAMQGRFMILAKVGNIHLPFYISSEGTGGKKQGGWYPFFGDTGLWIVKGKIDKSNGEMHYHPEITKIQEILNKNLIFPSSFTSPKGKFGGGKDKESNEPSTVYFDLNKHLKYQNWFFTEYKDKDEKKFVERITGYKPERVTNDGGPSVDKWIGDITKSIK